MGRFLWPNLKNEAPGGRAALHHQLCGVGPDLLVACQTTSSTSLAVSLVSATAGNQAVHRDHSLVTHVTQHACNDWRISSKVARQVFPSLLLELHMG